MAYFYIDAGLTSFKNHQGRRFIVDYKMDEPKQFPDPGRFFRVNRALIATHLAIRRSSLTTITASL